MRIPCPLLVGRNRELDLLRKRVTAAAQGSGSTLLLAGEAGIGKSRLVSETLEVAAGLGLPALRGRSVPGSDATAFRPLTEAFAADPDLPRPGEELASWWPALAGIVPSAPTVTHHEISGPVRGEAVVRLLGTAHPAGGVLVLEDLHWADRETLEVVEHLCDHAARTPFLCLVTVRTGEPSPAAELVDRVAAQRRATVLRLDRLNAVQVAAMVHTCSEGSTTPPDAAAVTRLADGVPFLVEELLVSPGLPTSVAESVAARLARVPADEQRVLVTAAAGGRDVDWRALGAATGLPDDVVVRALERGVAEMLLEVHGDSFRFRHALTAEAVFASVVPPRREQHAAALLAALERDGDLPAVPGEVAARLAERAGQSERAGALHAAGGRAALAQGALHSAVTALDAAVRLLPPGEARDDAGQDRVEALVLAGRYDDAEAAATDLLPRLPPDRAAAVRLRLAAGAAAASRWATVAAQVAAARPLVDAADAPGLTVELALREAELALGAGDPAGADEPAQRVLATEAASPAQRCEALHLLGRRARSSSLTEAEPHFREAARLAEAEGLRVWRMRSLHELGTIALLARSEVDDLLEAQSLAEGLGALGVAAVLDIEITAGLAAGDQDESAVRVRQHARRAVERGTALGLHRIAAWGWLHLAGSAWLRGERAEGDHAAARARDLGSGAEVDGLLCSMEGLGAVLDDDLDRAMELAEREREVLTGVATVPAPSRSLRSLLLALTGSDEAAAAITEARAAGVGMTPIGRGYLILAEAMVAGRTDPARASSLLADAGEVLDRVAPAFRHLGRRLAAEAAVRDRWPFPPEWLADTERWFREHGHDAAAARCRALRGRSRDGVPVSWAGYGITPREADVLALVVEGLTNQEIADRLFLSVRTVEKHVEALLRKTATASRTQLARVVT